MDRLFAIRFPAGPEIFLLAKCPDRLWDPSSLLLNVLRVQGADRWQAGLPPALTLVSCSAHSTLKMEAICSSETLIEFQIIIRRYITEDIARHIKVITNFLPVPS
jgi:hypothetical protein